MQIEPFRTQGNTERDCQFAARADTSVARVAGRAAIVLVTCVAIVGCSASPDLEISRKFQTAQNAFSKATAAEDYLKAAGLYQEILDTGFYSGAVLYNQGNAFMKANQRGRAIAAYRQASRLMPRDPYLEANLRFALQRNPLAPDDKSLFRTIFFWQNWLSYPEKFFVTTVVISIVILFASVGRFAKIRVFQRLTWFGLVLVVLCGVSTAIDWYNFKLTTHGVIAASEVVARKGDSHNYDPAFTKPLPEGTEFTVVEKRGEWVLIRPNQSGEGWVEQQATVTY